MSEFLKLSEEFPNFAFNDQEAKRNKNHSLLMIEACNIVPSNYNPEILKQYKTCYTWNSKFYDLIKDYPGIDIKMIKGFPLFDNYQELDYFLPIQQKKHAVSLICRYRTAPDTYGDITNLRYQVFMNLHIEKDCYGKIPYCQPYYKGKIGRSEPDTYPSSLAKLEVLNKYKFNLCFENCYHELWSYGMITEKIFDCLLAKTIPIYYGCHNIESVIPNDLYIDYRKFDGDSELALYLSQMSDTQIEDMTERAYEWIQENRYEYGDIATLKEVLKND
jgi:hypothetical protein